ncbi:MAG: hypothetical protein ACOX6E_02070 [Syntrophomonadaceae bacterium]|jgi:cell division protein FtsL
MDKLLYVLIGLVSVVNIIFLVFIWRQLIKFEKKALAAKQAKEKYLDQLRLEQEEENQKKGAQNQGEGEKKTNDNKSD